MNKEVIKRRIFGINAVVIILLFCIFVKVVFYNDSEVDYADEAVIASNYKKLYTKNSFLFDMGSEPYYVVNYGYISVDSKVSELKYSSNYEKIDDAFTFVCEDVIKTEGFTCTLKYNGELLGNIGNNYLNLLGFDLSYDNNLQLVNAYMEQPNFSFKMYKNRFTVVGNNNKINFQNNGIIKFKFMVVSSSNEDNFSIKLKNIVFSPKTKILNDLYITDNLDVSLELSHLEKYKYQISGNDLYFYESIDDVYKKINKYSCLNNTCEIESNYIHGSYINDDKVLIFDYNTKIVDLSSGGYRQEYDFDNVSNNKIVLFSYYTGILKEFDDSKKSSFYYLRDNNSIVKYFLGIDKSDGISKVVDLNGNIVRTLNNGNFTNMYSIENDYMVLKFDDKYTLEKISANLKIKDIYYDELKKMTDNIFIARFNDKLYIIDHNGQNLTNDYIELEMSDFFYSYYNKDNNVINLYIYGEGVNADNEKAKLFYQYDIVNNSLIKMEE